MAHQTEVVAVMFLMCGRNVCDPYVSHHSASSTASASVEARNAAGEGGRKREDAAPHSQSYTRGATHGRREWRAEGGCLQRHCLHLSEQVRSGGARGRLGARGLGGEEDTRVGSARLTVLLSSSLRPPLGSLCPHLTLPRPWCWPRRPQLCPYSSTLLLI